MKKLTSVTLDQMMAELTLLDESAQRRYVGGGDTCLHNMDLYFCPSCSGQGIVSFEDYLAQDSAGSWKGGWYLGPDGIPHYGFSSATATPGYNPITGYCKEHGRFEGDELCPWSHSGLGNEYCPEHHYWYDSSSCSRCQGETEVVTGYCGEHRQTWEERDGITGHCPDCGEGTTGVMVFCNKHDAYYDKSKFCPVCGENPEEESGEGTGGHGNNHPGTEDPEQKLPFYSTDYVVHLCADSTFNTETQTLLKDNLDFLNNDEVGNFLYARLFDKEANFIQFSIGKTTEVTMEDGTKQNALAQYADNKITFQSADSIDYGKLGEEMAHAVQNDIYGESFSSKNLNYEFEVKIVVCLLTGVVADGNLFKDREDTQEFRDFCSELGKGKLDDKTLITKYQDFFNKWEQAGYTSEPDKEKIPDFDPRLLKEINQFLHR